jgi:hypothetical protein
MGCHIEVSGGLVCLFDLKRPDERQPGRNSKMDANLEMAVDTKWK